MRWEIDMEGKLTGAGRTPAVESEMLSLSLRVALLEEIAKLVATAPEPEKLYQSLLDLVLTVVDAEVVALLLADEGEKNLTTAAVRGDRAGAAKSVKVPINQGITGWVATHLQPLALYNPVSDSRYFDMADSLVERPVVTLACIPMRTHERVVGVLQVFNCKGERVLSDDELDLLATLCGQAALVIENSRLVSRLTSINEELSALVSVVRDINSSLDFNMVLGKIIEAAVDVLDGEAGSILLIEEEKEELYFEAAIGEKGAEVKRHRLEIGEGIAGWVAQAGVPAYVSEPEHDPRFKKTISEDVGFPVRSILAAPLRVREEIIGVIEVLNLPAGDESRQTMLASAFANHAALAVQNARLHQRLEKRVWQTEQKLEEERKKIEAILENLANGVLLIDNEDNLLFANPTASEILDISPQDYGTQLSQVLGQKGLESAVHWLEKSEPGPLELQLLCEGKERLLQIKASAHLDSAGHPLGKIMILTEGEN